MHRVFSKVIKNDNSVPAFKQKLASPVTIIEMVDGLINQCILPQYKAEYKRFCEQHYETDKLKQF